MAVFMLDTSIQEMVNRLVICNTSTDAKGEYRITFPSQDVDCQIYDRKEQTFYDIYPESSLTGKCLDPLYLATHYAVKRHMFYGQRLPRWLMRLMLQHHQIVFMDGVLVSLFYLTRLQLEEIILHSRSCFKVHNLNKARKKE